MQGPLSPLDMLPELSAESSASTSGSAPSQPATPVDDERFADRMDLFPTPRKVNTDSKMMLFDERASRLLREAVEEAGLAQDTVCPHAVISRLVLTCTYPWQDMGLVRDISSTSVGRFYEDSGTLQPSNSLAAHQIIVRSPTIDTDTSSPSLSPDMPSLGRSVRVLHQEPFQNDRTDHISL